MSEHELCEYCTKIVADCRLAIQKLNIFTPENLLRNVGLLTHVQVIIVIFIDTFNCNRIHTERLVMIHGITILHSNTRVA